MEGSRRGRGFPISGLLRSRFGFLLILAGSTVSPRISFLRASAPRPRPPVAIRERLPCRGKPRNAFRCELHGCPLSGLRSDVLPMRVAESHSPAQAPGRAAIGQEAYQPKISRVVGRLERRPQDGHARWRKRRTQEDSGRQAPGSRGSARGPALRRITTRGVSANTRARIVSRRGSGRNLRDLIPIGSPPLTRTKFSECATEPAAVYVRTARACVKDGTQAGAQHS